MTREEKQKAIDALKISAPVIAVTQEEFNDYIQTLNQVMDWLEQESTIRNCFGCKYSKDNHNAGTEECHLCMWENQYTPKNDLAVDCVSRQFMYELGATCIATRNKKTGHLMALGTIEDLPSVTPQEPIKKLEEQIRQLQNRCHALTHGQVCVFCPYECEHKEEVKE